MQVIIGDESHVYNYEAGGMSVLGGIAFRVISNRPNGELPLDLLAKAVRYACKILILDSSET